MSDTTTLKMKENEIKLVKALDNASLIITKDYLHSLNKCAIISPREEDIDIDISECGKFYKLSKLVYDNKESFLDKLTTVINVVSSIECSLATVIKSDGKSVDYYLGIISKNSRMDNELHNNRRKSDAESFKGALYGNLTGSEMSELSSNEVNTFKKQITNDKAKSIACISGIVALRDDDNRNLENYVQGIENLVDSLRNKKYTIVMIADPLNSGNINEMRTGYEMMYSQLSVYHKSVLTMNESDTDSFSKSKTESVTEGLSTGISYTQSHSTSKGKNKGWSVGGGLSIIVASVNGSINRSKSEMTSDTKGTATNRNESLNRSSGESRTSTISNTKGKSLQLTYDNRTVKTLLDKIDKQIERLDECDSFGAFDCAAYVIADDKDTALSAASNYNALMRGKNSSIQSSQINIWNDQEQISLLSKYIGAFVHPRFYLDSDNNVVITPASVISGKELAIQIGLPKKSIPGVSVIPMAAFGRNIRNDVDDSISIGNLFHMGKNDGDEKVNIDIDSLTSHTFITGSTGSGKSSTVYTILDKLKKHTIRGSNEKIKFLVIEPAKGEYKNRFGYDDDVSVYGTNYLKTPILRINPFSFPSDVHVLEHIDRLIEIFNVCWPMYAAMPAVLKDSIERAYKAAGWDLRTSKCKYVSDDGICIFPNFDDILLQITKVVNESAYSSDSKGDYKGALCTRVRSLTNGIYSQIFTSNELTSKELFDKNVIVDLSRIGSTETKSLIMGILIIKLQEYRMSSQHNMNQSLKHVTVLEEAHNILKKTSSEQSSETANLAGKSVEMLANSIAEMRTYGEGFIIADQAPGLMDMSVIRNTNTKIILRLPDLNDRELVGRSANLNNEQTIELARLNTFVAAVYQNNWLEPVLCNMDVSFYNSSTYVNPKNEITNDESKIIKIVKYILSDNSKDIPNKKDLLKGIYRMPVSADVKIAFIRFIQYGDSKEKNLLKSKIIYGLFNSQEVIDYIRTSANNVNNLYQSIINELIPSISEFNQKEIHKIMACIAYENHQRVGNKESKEIFDKLMKTI